jgi:hypothetical protein
MGMYLMRMIGMLGQYKQPIPDFLVFLGWTELPTFWKPFDNFSFAMTMVFLLPGIVALVFGFLAFRSRIKGVYWLAAIDGITLDPAAVETNIVIFDVDDPDGLCAALERAAVRMGVVGERQVRAVTHLDVDADGVKRAVEAVATALEDRT